MGGNSSGGTHSINADMLQRAMSNVAIGDGPTRDRRQAHANTGRQGMYYPIGCTLVVDGVPYEASEPAFLPLLLTAFQHWAVNHDKIIGINIKRMAAHVQGVETYVNRGEVFVRSASKEYLEEYEELVRGKWLRCGRTGNWREVRTNPATRDLDIKPLGHRDYRPRFFDEVWKVSADS